MRIRTFMLLPVTRLIAPIPMDSNMKPNIIPYLACVTLVAWLAGCGHEGHSSMTGIEGTYVQTDNTNIILVFKKGYYQQGTKDIHAEGRYHAHAAGKGFELHIELTGALEGNQTTLLVEPSGDGIRVKDGDTGEELTFKKAE